MKGLLEKDAEQIRKLAGEIFVSEEVGRIERLGGLTNHTYAVEIAGGKYVFRLPGEGTEQLVNRKDEKISTELAGSIGVDTKLIYFNADTGIKITDYILEAETMSPVSMRKAQNIKEAAKLFRVLHTCGQDTKVSFEVFEMAEGYERIILEHAGAFYPDYAEIRKNLTKIKVCVDQYKRVKAPCHNDPLCENWIRGTERLYLVDWEYAGMNDPMWDLADLSIEADYNEEMDEYLLESYLGGSVGKKERLRFEVNKIYLDFLWSLWGKTRVPYDGDEMEKYAADRYQRLKRNIEKVNGYMEGMV